MDANPQARVIDLLCPRCAAHCERHWPVAGDFGRLLEHCPRCHRRYRLHHDQIVWPIRTLPHLTPAERDHQDATHEAAHAVVAALVGIPVVRVEVGASTVAAASNWHRREPVSAAGGVTYDCDPGQIDMTAYLAMVWTGQQAGLRWLRDHGYDTPSNRVGIRYLGWDDTAYIDSWTVLGGMRVLPECAGQDLADLLLDTHRTAVTTVAEQLRRDRCLDGATIRQLLASAGVNAKGTATR